MGSLSIWHLLIVLVLLGAPVLAIVFIVRLTTGKSPPTARTIVRSSGLRLQELNELKAKGLMTEHEFQQKRAEVLKTI